MKVLSLFSGIGAFEKALTNLEVPFELIGFSEIDKYAIKSYCAIHNVSETLNLGDITKVDTKTIPGDIDLLTYGFPCQDISLAGKQQGLFNKDGTNTRSGLFFEALRIIEDVKPKIAIAENVKNLTSKKFNAQFQIVLQSLEEAGYNNYWAVLNLKDFGIPQNRERVFIVSIRKDVDTGSFEFPCGFPLELRLKDMLEDEVDEKFYISDKMKDYLFNISDKNKARGNGNVYTPTDVDGISKTITTKEGQRVKDNFIEVFDSYNGKQIDSNICGSFLVREATKKGYAEACEGDSINLEQPNSTTRRGRVGKQVAQTLTTSPQQACVVPINPMSDGTCRTIKNQYYKNSKANFERTSTFGATGVQNGLRIRKLTPKECFRLMGFFDEDFAKAEAVNSNTQLYKQAGNSIGVPVVEYIIKALFECGVLKNERIEKEMELKVQKITFPEVIEFNFEELRTEITAKVESYKTLVYTDEQIGIAKTDLANLRKFTKALSDERIKVKKECLKPYEVFEQKIKELTAIVDEGVSNIDRQVKDYDEQRKSEKLKAIVSYFNNLDHPEWLYLESIFSEKWLNASVKMSAVEEEINIRLIQIEKHLEILAEMPEFAFEATEAYKMSLDINKAIAEGKRLADIAKRKAEQENINRETKIPEEPKTVSAVVNDEPEKKAVCFRAYLTVDDAKALKDFFNSRNIQFEKI